MKSLYKTLFFLFAICLFAACDKDGSKALETHRVSEMLIYDDDVLEKRHVFTYEGELLSNIVIQRKYEDEWIDITNKDFTYDGNIVSLTERNGNTTHVNSVRNYVFENNKLTEYYFYRPTSDTVLELISTYTYKYENNVLVSMDDVFYNSQSTSRCFFEYTDNKIQTIESYNIDNTSGEFVLEAMLSFTYDKDKISAFSHDFYSNNDEYNVESAKYTYDKKKVSQIEYSNSFYNGIAKVYINKYEYNKENLLRSSYRYPSNERVEYTYEEQKGNAAELLKLPQSIFSVTPGFVQLY